MKKLFMILVSLSVSLLLAACGSAGGASNSIKVTMTDFQFMPDTFTVKAGAPVSFTATNNGAVEHTFVIMQKGHEITTQFTDSDKGNIYWQKPAIASGSTVTDTFTAPSEPGEYQIVCDVPGHFTSGMTAKLVVVAP